MHRREIRTIAKQSVGYAIKDFTALGFPIIIVNGMLEAVILKKVPPMSPGLIGVMIGANLTAPSTVEDILNPIIAPIKTYEKIKASYGNEVFTIGYTVYYCRSLLPTILTAAIGGMTISLINFDMKLIMPDTRNSKFPLVVTIAEVAAEYYLVSQGSRMLGMVAWSIGRRYVERPRDRTQTEKMPSCLAKYHHEHHNIAQAVGYGWLRLVQMHSGTSGIILIMQAIGEHFEQKEVVELASNIFFDLGVVVLVDQGLKLAEYLIHDDHDHASMAKRFKIRQSRDEEDREAVMNSESSDDLAIYQPSWRDKVIDGIWAVSRKNAHAMLCTTAGYAVSYFYSGFSQDENALSQVSVMTTTMVATDIVAKQFIYPVATSVARLSCSLFAAISSQFQRKSLEASDVSSPHLKYD